jgi:predicted nucleic acid-binding protein
MTLTFVDSGVLIAAARGTSPVSAAATAILVDPGRQFVSSDFVRLEVLPKPIYHKQVAEADFYRAFFASVAIWAATTPLLAQRAYQHASAFGLSAVDALHVAAADLAGAEELITTERASKPLFRVTVLRIVSIHP